MGPCFNHFFIIFHFNLGKEVSILTSLISLSPSYGHDSVADPEGIQGIHLPHPPPPILKYPIWSQ